MPSLFPGPCFLPLYGYPANRAEWLQFSLLQPLSPWTLAPTSCASLHPATYWAVAVPLGAILCLFLFSFRLIPASRFLFLYGEWIVCNGFNSPFWYQPLSLSWCVSLPFSLFTSIKSLVPWYQHFCFLIFGPRFPSLYIQQIVYNGLNSSL